MAARIDLEAIRRAPKVLLHDHLDGGLRPTTVIELAAEAGHQLPTTDPDDLRRWFHEGADRRDLDLYLQTFEHTVACMQTPEHIERVAAESMAGAQRFAGGAGWHGASDPLSPS